MVEGWGQSAKAVQPAELPNVSAMTAAGATPNDSPLTMLSVRFQPMPVPIKAATVVLRFQTWYDWEHPRCPWPGVEFTKGELHGNHAE